MKLKASVLIVALLASGAHASAHGIWVGERHDDLAIVYGHGGTDEGYDPAKLTSLIGKAADGSERPVTIERLADHVLFQATDDTVIAVATFDNGFWTEGPDGKWVNKPRTEVEGAKQSGHYIKYATAILRQTNIAPAPQGAPLEIVPLVDPMTLRAGQDLPIQVLLNGKPAPDVGVTVEYTTASAGEPIRTDTAGKATLTVRNQGLNVVAASFNEPTPDSPEAAQIGHFATLSFSLAHGGE